MSGFKRLWMHAGAYLSISYLPVITICGVAPDPQPGPRMLPGKNPWDFFPPLREPEGPRPWAVVHPKPEYPLEAKRKNLEGTILLEVRVSRNGGVGSITVFKSTGHKLLDQAAITTMRQWRFKPGCADRLRTVLTYSLHCATQ